MTRSRDKKTPQPQDFAQLARQAGGVTRAVNTLGLNAPVESVDLLNTQVRMAVIEFALNRPTYGPVRAAKELQNRGLDVSPQGVRDILGRYALNKLDSRRHAKMQFSAIARQHEQTTVDAVAGPRLSLSTLATAFTTGALAAALLLHVVLS